MMRAAAVQSAFKHFQDAPGPDHRDTRIARELIQTLEAR
jgi:hypothetical protein